MNIIDTLKGLKEVSINDDFISRVEALYEESLAKEIKQILSINKEAIFFDGSSFLKLLSNDEVLDATQDMAVDFKLHNLIPVFDLGDNDYICYNLNSSTWCKFNIVEELQFSKSETLLNYF